MRKNNQQELQPSSEEIKGIDKKPDEEILLHLKQHPMILYRFGLLLVVCMLVLVALFTIFGASMVSSLSLGIFLGVGGYYSFRDWYLWWSSHYILTTERVISVDQKGFFHREVSEAPLDKIQNVSFDIEGPYQTFMDYGIIRILTAGHARADVTFSYIGKPYEVQQIISDAAQRFAREHIVSEEDHISENKAKGKVVLR